MQDDVRELREVLKEAYEFLNEHHLSMPLGSEYVMGRIRVVLAKTAPKQPGFIE